MNVKNRACIRKLSFRQFKAGKTRNIVAVLAIALTTLLFASLFTIAMSVNEGFQQSNFRMVGGYSHGNFKNLTSQQAEELADDPLIEEYGLRYIVGMPQEVPFNKTHVEVSYCSGNTAKWMYCEPTHGRLPREGTNEAATDTRVLGLLGVEPEIGAEFTMSFDVDGTETTQTFTLCGWWENDAAIPASHVLVPQSRADDIFESVGLVPGEAKDGLTAMWGLDVMLADSVGIEDDLKEILANHGYQSEKPAHKDDFIDIGVNWGYTGAQFTESLDPATLLAVASVLLLIVFTGYLVIYNVFQISVHNDIRFYGLLKTIGTTPRQIARIVRQQAFLLCALGIPLGLLGGWFVGASMVPMVVSHLNGVASVVSASPAIFLAAALFSLVTVLLSCRRPGRLAGKVSPVDAVKYVGGNTVRRSSRRASRHFSLLSMALANLGRNRGKTVVTVLSLALAVVLLNLTVVFARGFDMEKYLEANVASDYVVADAAYFQVGGYFSSDSALPQSAVDQVNAQGGIERSGRILGKVSSAKEFVEEDHFRRVNEHTYDPENVERMIDSRERSDDGRLAVEVQLYGMDEFPLSRLKVLEGDLAPLSDPNAKAVAAVYSVDDYGKPHPGSNWAKVGDTVTVRYVDEKAYFYSDSMEPIPDEKLEAVLDGSDPRGYVERSRVYRDVEYTVCALVEVPTPLSYRYYGPDEFVMSADQFASDSGTQQTMSYVFDVEDGSRDAMDSFLAEYTQEIAPQCDFESRATYEQEFEEFRSTFLMLGGVLSFIVGLVGVLNFLNTILTGIVVRKKEFAALQAIGMTGRQLKTMLAFEGLLYTMAAGALSLAMASALSPLAANALGNMFWFVTYRFTVEPILVVLPVFVLLGVLIPLVVYRFASKATIVERLREIG